MRKPLAFVIMFVLGAVAASGCVVGGDPTHTVYFQSDRNGNWDIYSVQHDGTMVTRVTDHTWDDVYPAVSPDGNKLAFIRRLGATTDVILAETNGGEERNITNGRAGGAVESLTWYPGGDRLLLTISSASVASGRAQLYWMSEEGVADDDTGMNLLSQDTRYAYSNPRMNGTGEEIAVSATLSDGTVDVHILDAAGTFLRLTPQETFLRPTGDFRAPDAREDYPEYAPNGRDVILQSDANAGTNRNRTIHLWYVSSQGRRSADRTPNTPYNNMQPAWSSVLEDPTIAFVSDRDGDNEIYLWSMDDTEPVRLTDNPASDTNPSWLKNAGG